MDMKENKDHLSLEIKCMTLPIQFRYNNKKGLNFASTLLKIFKPNILREHNKNDYKWLIRFGI
jgi:hypothetical protein